MQSSQGQASKAKNAEVRELGQQMETLQDQIDNAEASGQDTTELENQMNQLEQQLADAIQRRKAARQQAQADRKAQKGQGGQGGGQGRATAPGQQKKAGSDTQSSG